MSVFAHVEGLGDLIEECVSDSVIAWRMEFKPGTRTVDTLAEHLYDIEVVTNIRPQGVAMVTVQVKGKGYLDSSVACFRMKRGRNRHWVITASSLKD